MTTPELRLPEDGSGTRGTPQRLTRSREDRMIAGVAGGLGRYFAVDPVIVRVAFVLLAIAGGGGVLAYIVAWIVIPEATDDERPIERPSTGSAQILGIVFVILGAVLLIDRILPAFTWFSWRYAAPVVLVAIGLALLTRKETP